MAEETVRPVAVVTGANRGIGREVARQLAARGHRVVVGSRDLERGRRVAAALDGSGRDAVACRLDVADDASVAAMVAEVTRTFASQTADAVFELGVEIILDGLEARVASAP